MSTEAEEDLLKLYLAKEEIPFSADDKILGTKYIEK